MLKSLEMSFIAAQHTLALVCPDSRMSFGNLHLLCIRWSDVKVKWAHGRKARSSGQTGESIPCVCAEVQGYLEKPVRHS